MKQQISPAVAAVVIIIVVGIAAFFIMRSGAVQHEEKPPPMMPESVAKEWQKYTGGKAAGPPGANSSIPVVSPNAPSGGPR